MGKIVDDLIQRYLKNNIIQAAFIELTYRCPCDCIHCYLNREKKEELSTEEIFNLLEQLKSEGAMNLGITGGEPFLRKDIEQILRKARELHFYVSLLTTGILIKETDVKMMEDCRVENIDISLHGANAETHDAIMQFPGAFDRTMKALKLLTSSKIHVTIKMVVMKQNYTQINQIQQIAESVGATFLPQILLVPKEDGNKNPQNYMLTKDDFLNLHVDSASLTNGVLPNEDFSTGAVMACTAGNVVVSFSPYGDVFPCLLLRQSIGNIRKNTLNQIWHQNEHSFLQKLRYQKKEDVTKCYQCELISYCQRCPGAAYLETKDINGAPQSCCDLAAIMKAWKQKK